MKKLHTMMLVLFGFSFLAADCSKENNDPNTVDENTELIFGNYFGHCFGNCVHLYKMKDGELFADLMDQGNPAEATFGSTPLTNEKYQEAMPVMETFPEELLDEEKSTIGCPDCADQGGYFIQITRDGETRTWKLDTNQNSLPSYLKSYTNLIRETMEKLRL